MRSIRTKFTALTATAIIISVVAVGLVSAQFIWKVAREYLEELLMLKCTNIEETLDSYLSNPEREKDYDSNIIKGLIAYDGHFEDAYTFLVSKDDEIIYHPDVPAGTPLGEISETLTADELPSMQSVMRITYGGMRQRVTWSELSNGMRLYLAVPESSINAYWYRYLSTFGAAAILMLIFFAALSAVVSSRITRPLTELTEAARRIDSGDYNVDLSYKGDDEVGVLTGTFRQLTDHLKTHISDLNDMAYKDALTSVRNKGAFDMYMRSLDESIRSADPEKAVEFAICMFDCNDLKGVNDNFGHDKGDLFLKNTCSLICNVFTHSPVFRLGGDEFVCIMQSEDYMNRDRLIDEFDRRSEDISGRSEAPWYRIDAARGMAVYDPAKDRCADDVYKRADAYMYEDKQRKKANEK